MSDFWPNWKHGETESRSTYRETSQYKNSRYAWQYQSVWVYGWETYMSLNRQHQWRPAPNKIQRPDQLIHNSETVMTNRSQNHWRQTVKQARAHRGLYHHCYSPFIDDVLRQWEKKTLRRPILSKRLLLADIVVYKVKTPNANKLICASVPAYHFILYA